MYGSRGCTGRPGALCQHNFLAEYSSGNLALQDDPYTVPNHFVFAHQGTKQASPRCTFDKFKASRCEECVQHGFFVSNLCTKV
jgi:hypothetical protein